MKFSDIPAHESIKQRLRSLVDSDKIPHAILFEGTPGIGKFAMARAMVQYLHCTDKHDGDSCGKCPSCIQHQTFNHIDTFYSFPVIKKKNSGSAPISDDFITEWKNFLKNDMFMNIENWLKELGNPSTLPTIYVTESDSIASKMITTSHSTRYKVVLMWLPERMNETCANKMLKMLEEPFSDSIFILVTNNSTEILPTIYSRCQRFLFKRLDNETVADFLSEKFSVEKKVAQSISHIASGSISEALKQLSIDKQSQQYLTWFMNMMRLAYQRKILDLRKLAYDISSIGREQQIGFLEYCSRQLRENFIYNIGDSRLVYLNNEELNFSKNFARFINEKNVLKLNRVFLDGITDISGNANAKFVFFDIMVRVILLLKS